MGVLGAAVEAAVMLFDIPLSRFWALFLASRWSSRFASGDPATLTGQSGWELAERVLSEAGVVILTPRVLMFFRVRRKR